MAIPQLLNMGLSGVPFVGTDIGGFNGNASGELFVRWMQFGVLAPFCRSHSEIGTERHEPWIFGPRVEAICREFLRLRYRLLPYLYTLFWEAAQRGIPVLRPLLYHFPDDPATYPLHDQALLGHSCWWHQCTIPVVSIVMSTCQRTLGTTGGLTNCSLGQRIC
jgi:alpha-glucosidase